MSMFACVRMLVFAALLGGCGVHSGASCKDYEPLNFCPVDTEFICETSRGGCRQCTCMPMRGGRPNDQLR